MEIPEDVRKRVESLGGIEKIMEMLPDDEHLKRKSRVYRALSDPVRLCILHLLSISPLCVCLIKQAVRMSDSKLSYHLSVLKNAGLITGKRKRNWIIYEITENGLRYVD